MHGTLLHAEDDPSVSAFVRSALRAYRVESVSTGLDALKAVSEDPQRYGLVILDLVLPWVNGLDVLAALRQSPETASLPVLVTTGTYVTPNEFAGDRHVSVLRKPFGVQQLRVAVEQMLLRGPAWR